MSDRLLTTREVAAYLQVSAATLCRLRQTGEGPPVIWVTARTPRYSETQVRAWVSQSSVSAASHSPAGNLHLGEAA